VAQVDPDDDGRKRFVVHHYRFDPGRRERRHVVVAAFDTESEFLACMDSVREEIECRRNRGEPVDPHEHASGTVLEPGYRRRAAIGRQMLRAVRHGDNAPLPEETPANMSIIRAERPPG
jgi:hypothetical protein